MKSTDRFREQLADFLTALLRLLPAETAHNLATLGLQSSIFRRISPPNYAINLSGMKTKIPGIADLSHPVGLAAGFDKNARMMKGLAQLGFSFLELGTITPRPQLGNPKPRMFRYSDQHALINRMGFNSDGSEKVHERLMQSDLRQLPIPIGINLGKNKGTMLESAIEDYSSGIQTFSNYSDYLVINLSSPNTEGLRSLANSDFLKSLARNHTSQLDRIWLKLDPDSDKKSFQKLIETICQLDYQGVILCNTHKVQWPEEGGLSGHPLMSLSNSRLEWAYEVHQGSLPMIASGGIFSGIDVLEKIKRGACAVQIYSALVFRGPWAVYKILRELQAEMEAQGMTHLIDVQGSFFHGG